ncbi:MAG: c-type cytochrome [Janthinobacterium lividum]
MHLRLIAASLLTLAIAHPAAARVGDQAQSGKAIYERANCVGCHKWSGVGGGGYGGSALSLRGTSLDKEQIEEIVTCGRPTTGMPHFTTDPYKDGKCYGMSQDDVKDIMPPSANVVLGPQEIDAVADYVLANIKGKGDPNLADCVAFFGDTSRVCDIYRPKAPGASHHAMPTPTTTGQ